MVTFVRLLLVLVAFAFLSIETSSETLSNHSENVLTMLVDPWFATLQAHDIDGWIELHSNSVVWHFPETGGELTGHQSLRRAIQNFITKHPDIRFDKTRVFSQGNRICLEWTEVGTDQETGDRISYYFCGILIVDGGKISEVHRYGGKRTIENQ